ncbi:helix-turn-helix domain-containing protein [Nocardiopsis halotolerans]|uniref:helix-turn-helix domain-containing protein n=1 Tax=Nocardiopsis halotolerans TaxID=124252 RepID=UPI000345EEA5|nr:helix-turn-helix domain-containing protein [Nocardiopsis halotolerans]
MATIGQTLSAARVAAGHTVADLSIRTRIRETVLTSIEREDFVPCGGDFYARGHIRGICRALGLDPAPLLAEYDREHASRAIPVFVPPQRHLAPTPDAIREAAAARAQTRTGEDGEAVMERRFGEDDSGVGAQRWGHFERRQILARPRAEEPGNTRTAWIPWPRDTGEGRRGGRQAQGGGPTRGVPAHGRPVRGGPRKGGPAHGRRQAGRHGVGGPVSRPLLAGHRPATAVRRHWPWAVVGVIFLLAIFVGIRTWQDWDAGNPLRAAFSSGSSAEANVDSASAGGTGAKAAAGTAPEEPVEFTVAIEASGRSWIEVTGADEETLYVGYILEGDVREYVTEDTINLWTGDAGALSVTVDGEGAGPLGLPGEVKEVTIGPEGVKR